MPATPELFLGVLSGSRISRQPGLYNYSCGQMIPLDWVLVNKLEEPVLAASHHPAQASALFLEYPKLEWIVDLTTSPVRLYTRQGIVPITKLVPGYCEERSHSLEVILALACTLAIGLILLAIL